MVSDGLNNIIKLDLGGPCPAVVDDGLPVRPIPAVHWGETTGGSAPASTTTKREQADRTCGWAENMRLAQVPTPAPFPGRTQTYPHTRGRYLPDHRTQHASLKHSFPCIFLCKMFPTCSSFLCQLFEAPLSLVETAQRNEPVS